MCANFSRPSKSETQNRNTVVESESMLRHPKLSDKSISNLTSNFHEMTGQRLQRNTSIPSYTEPHTNSTTTRHDEEVERVDIIPSTRASIVRALALLCACSLSVGSHYASYTLGPLKSRLAREINTSNTEFSLLISAFSLNSTWTPLVGGFMASKLGTTLTSIIATSVIFVGQVLLLVGDIKGDIRLMVFGLFVFGFGVSPLAVVQESIIIRFFKSHGLGVSMALGLVAGKLASFISARTSLPLAERFGRHAPFYVSTFLAALSLLINLVYMASSKWLIRGSGTVLLEASEIRSEARRRSLYDLSEAQTLESVAKKRHIRFKDIPKLGDIFWAYIGLNILCGTIWAPFTHLAANLFEKRYGLTEHAASTQASYLLVGSILLYPATGFTVDRMKHPQAALRMFTLSSVLMLFGYAWLVLPPAWTGTPFPAVAAFATGIGFSPFLVPQLVPFKFVSTTLGVHKSMEQTGATIFQTIAGLVLDGDQRVKKGDQDTTQQLLNVFLAFNVLQLLGIIGLSHLDSRRRQAAETLENTIRDEGGVERESEEESTFTGGEGDILASEIGPLSSQDPRKPLLGRRPRADSGASCLPSSCPPQGVRGHPEIRRGRIFVCLCAMLISSAWVLFLSTAWLRLRSGQQRDSH
ncbi:major facilitator superfamily domain-containing protein [Suillus bovinus]|uniref:major facilitator superfamily domain-containing protein n=1 Tax=Suillus bovinus TaxID=48563 RepID=UPI001B86DE5F|nr:major facilitator superfamily domain-containing protein [Suillus bovinus]KAG2159888.1 major facilitator superfamily domain-containing protein [Suillus bovinus]